MHEAFHISEHLPTGKCSECTALVVTCGIARQLLWAIAIIHASAAHSRNYATALKQCFWKDVPSTWQIEIS